MFLMCFLCFQVFLKNKYDCTISFSIITHVYLIILKTAPRKQLKTTKKRMLQKEESIHYTHSILIGDGTNLSSNDVIVNNSE